MAGTRSSERKAVARSSPTNGDRTLAGQKRKPTTQKVPKRDHKKQATLEETLVQKGAEGYETNGAEMSGEEQAQDVGKEVSEDEEQEHDNNNEKTSAVHRHGAIEETGQRKKQIPSNILEKGVIYFFTRNRVGVEDAEGVGDLQRTFFVMRPLPSGATLGDGKLQDLKNNRLLALPKKTFPKSHKDRFMAFVEKANVTIEDLKENFFSANEYETKTLGTRRTEPVTPVAEGVYAITRTQDTTTHLVYSTTIPSELGEVQEDLGIKSQGSFIISVKNPERAGPSSAQLPEKPDFSKEIIEEFRGLAWSNVKPKYLDYPYCQILLIGDKIDKAVEPTKEDQKQNKDSPQQELENLEHEDELRVQHLHGDDSVYDDLDISKAEYPKVPTTW